MFDAESAEAAVAVRWPGVALEDDTLSRLLADRLRSAPRVVHVAGEGGDAPKVVFCTTENDMAHIQEAINAGANEYIMKPFDSDIIQSKLSQIGIL